MMETASAPRRPELTPDLSGDELLRWYWLKTELAALARTLGISASGSKEVLTRRLVAALDGDVFTEPTPRNTAGGAQLSDPVDASSIIPRGQRCSQVVRRWFVQQVGASFHFDATMREFFAQGDGTRTLQDALDHYSVTRDSQQTEIDPQFEYNRFTRKWHTDHPETTREDLLAAWQLYRSQSVDERGRV